MEARHVLTAMIVIGSIFLHAMSSNLTVAIVAMVNQTAISETIQGTKECSNVQRTTNSTVIKLRHGKYNLDPASQGIILGAITYGLLCTHLIGGILSHKIGPKWVVAGGTLVSIIFCSVVPTAADFGVGALVLARFLQGLGLGVITPGTYYLLVRWAPVQERSVIVTISTVGSIVGGTAGTVAAGFLSESEFMGGWPAIFYLPAMFTAIGASLWLILWICFVYNDPEKHPRISADEAHLIKSSHISQSLTQQEKKIPWLSIFCSLPFWALIVMRFAHMWAMSTLATAFPIYMDSVLAIDIEKNGVINGILYMMSLFGIFFGYISDILRRKTKLSITFIRKLFCSIAYIGCAVCFISMPYAGCNVLLLTTLLFVAKIFIAVSIAGDSVAIMDMAPNLAGTIFGATATIASTAGVLSPMYTGFITDNDMSISQWKYIFFTAATIYIVCLTFFLAFGSARIQPWAKSDMVETSSAVSEKSVDYGSLSASYKSPNSCEITKTTERFLAST